MALDTDTLPRIAAAIFRKLLPQAEREEVLNDLAAEHAELARTAGRIHARLWLWLQLLGSIPALVRRIWWRGWTGFEPRSSRMEPGGSVFESWIIDLRYSARRIASRPAYAAPAPVYVDEYPACRMVRERFWDGYGWRVRRYEVCN